MDKEAPLDEQVPLIGAAVTAGFVALGLMAVVIYGLGVAGEAALDALFGAGSARTYLRATFIVGSVLLIAVVIVGAVRRLKRPTTSA